MALFNIMVILAAQATSATPPPATEAPEQPVKKASSFGSTTYVELEGGAGHSTNPNLSLGDDTGSGFGRLSIHGVHTRVSDRTITLLSGFAQSTFYLNEYGSQQSVNVNARHDVRVNEKLRIFGDAGFTYDEGGQLDTRIIGLPDVPLLPGTTEPPIITPTGDFISVRGKHYSASGNVGAQISLSARESMSATAGIQHVIFKNGGVDTHYTSVPISLAYDRQINANTTLGVRGVAQYTDYSGPGSTRILTPQVTISTMLSERLSANAAVGASFSSIDDGISTRHRTGLTASAGVCWRGELDQLCGRASIDQQSATVIGPSKSINGGIDYSRTLGPDQTIALSLSVSRYSTPFTTIVGQSSSHPTYFRAAADYSRRISNRWFGGVNASARKVTQAGPDPKMDFSASAFVRYRLGDLR